MKGLPSPSDEDRLDLTLVQSMIDGGHHIRPVCLWLWFHVYILLTLAFSHKSNKEKVVNDLD